VLAAPQPCRPVLKNLLAARRTRTERKLLQRCCRPRRMKPLGFCRPAPTVVNYAGRFGKAQPRQAGRHGARMDVSPHEGQPRKPRSATPSLAGCKASYRCQGSLCGRGQLVAPPGFLLGHAERAVSPWVASHAAMRGLWPSYHWLLHFRRNQKEHLRPVRRHR
jgi:hypothetical protein